MAFTEQAEWMNECMLFESLQRETWIPVCVFQAGLWLELSATRRNSRSRWAAPARQPVLQQGPVRWWAALICQTTASRGHYRCSTKDTQSHGVMSINVIAFTVPPFTADLFLSKHWICSIFPRFPSAPTAVVFNKYKTVLASAIKTEMKKKHHSNRHVAQNVSVKN